MVINRTCAARGASEGRSLLPSHQLEADRSSLSAAASPAASAEMHTGGWRDVAVDAEMQLGVEPSSAVIIVIGTITVTLRTLRQCGRGCVQQQRHCHDKFRCTHGSISSRSRSTASHCSYRQQRCLFVRLIHKNLRSRPDGAVLAHSAFPGLHVDAAPTVFTGSLEEIETGERNYVMAVAFDCLAGLPLSCGTAFRSIRSHSFVQPGIHSRRAYARVEKDVGG
jgi:hypothetical protein